MNNDDLKASPQVVARLNKLGWLYGRKVAWLREHGEKTQLQQLSILSLEVDADDAEAGR